MKKILKIFAIMLFIIIFTYSFAKAESVDELREKRETIKTEIDNITKNMENIQIELTANLEEISKLDEKIYNYETEIEKINNQINNLDNEVKENKSKLENIEKDYSKQKKAFESRLVALYEAGETKYLDVLLNSKNIIDFISNYYLISEIAEYDNDLLENISREKQKIESISKGLQESQENLKELRKTQEKSMIALENAKVVRNSYANNLSTEEKELQSKIDKCKSDLSKIDIQILYLTLGNVNSDFVGGEFAWPAPGYTTITSPFGMRIHPLLNVYSLHTGVDIGAPEGAYVIAANDGVVTTASELSAYGNTIIIDHGGGVSTLYAHGSKLIAQVGDIVKRGDIIMEVGTTGWSTGPHLHFGISINGEYVDPYSFITYTEENNIN